MLLFGKYVRARLSVLLKLAASMLVIEGVVGSFPGPPDCSNYNISDSVLFQQPPQMKPKSAIGRVFEMLEDVAELVPQSSGPPCYEWICQSKERKGENCRWCLPSLFVGGIAKCGTTALCDKLVTHPDVRFYKSKETDIFTKMRFSVSEFERKINTEEEAHKHSKMDKEITQRRSLRRGHKLRIPGRHTGEVWLDCSAGAFRDLNAAAFLRRYSPDTKIVFIVRDPWQSIGSRLVQQSRSRRNINKSMLKSIKAHFRRLQVPPQKRFFSNILLRLARATDYTYAEKLLYWKTAFSLSNNMLVVDQHALQHNPSDTMYHLESFLNLRHVNYTQQVLQGISHNANQGNQNNNQPVNNSTQETSSDLFIHQPYSFTDDKEFLELSRNLLYPSLCLFEKVFGWKIHIITESECGNNNE